MRNTCRQKQPCHCSIHHAHSTFGSYYHYREGALLQRLALASFVLTRLWAQDSPFGAGLYQVMEKAACRSCHNADGVASATRLQFPDPGSPPEKIEAFGRSLVELINRDHPDSSLLLIKPTNRTSHGGGERIKAGSPDETILKAWIRQLGRLSGV